MVINIEFIATVLLVLAVVHTFSVKIFQKIAKQFKEGTVLENLFHLLGEVEVVFGFWSLILFIFIFIFSGSEKAHDYLNSRDFTEPLFVFVIMTVCATRPVLVFIEDIILKISTFFPFERALSIFFVLMTLGPLLGSLITEPAAMTLTALILRDLFFTKNVSFKFKYMGLALLFVNVSIGGVLTHFAAPPVLMVAKTWNWDMGFMLSHFGWKAVIAILVSNLVAVFAFKNEFKKIIINHQKKIQKIPIWVSGLHLFFIFLIVYNSHFSKVFMALFLFFLGVFMVTKEYQTELKLKESLLVGFFLSGLVFLGGLQSWWLTPLISSIDSGVLFSASTILTAITDNAALTYLGSQVGTLGDLSKYALVAGAVTGGGLTVIANAPNPAGYSLLNPSFGSTGINPLRLFLYALVPTGISAICFWWL